MKQYKCIRDCWWQTRYYPGDIITVQDDVKVPRHFEPMPEKQTEPEEIKELSDVEFEEPTEIEEAEKAEKSKKEEASKKK